MGKNSGYNENMKKSALAYRKEKQHSVSLSYKQDIWEQEIFPKIKSSGIPVATFIKQAVDEKIARMQNNNK